jgi:hypothetical protein
MKVSEFVEDLVGLLTGKNDSDVLDRLANVLFVGGVLGWAPSPLLAEYQDIHLPLCLLPWAVAIGVPASLLLLNWLVRQLLQGSIFKSRR